MLGRFVLLDLTCRVSAPTFFSYTPTLLTGFRARSAVEVAS